MKTIALLVHDDAGQEARLQAALGMARAFQGHLICVEIAVPLAAGDPFGGMAPVLTSAELVRESANRARIEARLQEELVGWDWVELVGDIATCLARAATFADLIVVDRDTDALIAIGAARAAGELLVRTGKPILAVPADSLGFDPAGRALIAWDGSASANAAMRAALPLLRHATDVALVEFDDGSVPITAEDAATYLARHGILATVHPPHPLAGNAGKALLERVERDRADYLVMGGYGHSRLRERLFGGVTRTLLSKSPVPLFLAHAPSI